MGRKYLLAAGRSIKAGLAAASAKFASDKVQFINAARFRKTRGYSERLWACRAWEFTFGSRTPIICEFVLLPFTIMAIGYDFGCTWSMQQFSK